MDDGNDSDAWTLGFSPVEFSHKETQMEAEEDEECMCFNHTSGRQRWRGVILGKARDSQFEGLKANVSEPNNRYGGGGPTGDYMA